MPDVPTELPSLAGLRRYPLTSAICAIALLAYGVEALGWDPRPLFYMAPAMLTGEWWRWITPSFLHLGGFHLIANLFWAWMIGVWIERYWGSWLLAVLFLVGAIGGTLGGLLAKEWGVGMSDVVYALAAFILVIPRRDRRMAPLAIPGLAQMLLGWLVLGVILSETGLFPIGNAAHAGGGIAGIVVALVLPIGTAKAYPIFVPPEMEEVYERREE